MGKPSGIAQFIYIYMYIAYLYINICMYGYINIKADVKLLYKYYMKARRPKLFIFL